MVQRSLSAEAGPSERYAWYALALLFMIGLLSFLDRTILSILQIPIKAELGLADSQLGLLTGLAFAVFYVSVGLPIARIADRRSRKAVITISLAIWTICTAACAYAPSFGWLLVLRIGLAIGEAGGPAPVHSLLSDYFPREKRAIALSIWSTSMLAGVMLAFLIGGTLSVAIGWRHTFLVIGIGGFMLVPLIALTLREPPRGRFDGSSGQAAVTSAPKLGATFKHLLRLHSYRNVCLAGGLIGYADNAMLVWNAPFYSRVHGLSMGDLAVVLSLLKGIGGIAGVIIGGYLVHRLGRRDVRWYGYVPALSALVIVPFALAQYWVDSAALSLCLAIVPAIAGSIYLGPIITVVQSVSPANMRAFASAGMAVATSLIGYGLGPTAVGVTSDLLVSTFGLETTSLRWAIPLQLWAAVAAAVLFARSSRRLVVEMQQLHGELA